MTIAFTQNELNLKISIVTKVTEHFVNSDDFGPFFTLLYDIGTLMFSKEKRFNEKKLMPTAGFEPGPPDQKTSALPTRLPRHLIECL